jgi:hypothetical protein
MPDDEKTFTTLHELVGESALAWVLPQVDDEIRRGKAGVRELDKATLREVFEDSGPGQAGRQKRKTQEFTTVAPFSASEKLDLLMQAVMRVVGEIPAVQAGAMSVFASDNIREVTFLAEDDIQPPLHLEAGESRSHASVEDLARLFGSLRS